MAIPTYEQMLQPLLSLAAKQDITRKDASGAMADHFRLSQEDRELRIPSGQSTYVHNRVGWAMTFLTKGGLIAKVAPRTYRITDGGRAFLAEHPESIAERDLAKLPGWKEAWHTSKREKATGTADDQGGATPLEALDSSISTLNADLKNRLAGGAPCRG